MRRDIADIVATMRAQGIGLLTVDDEQGKVTVDLRIAPVQVFAPTSPGLDVARDEGGEIEVTPRTAPGRIFAAVPVPT